MYKRNWDSALKHHCHSGHRMVLVNSCVQTSEDSQVERNLCHRVDCSVSCQTIPLSSLRLILSTYDGKFASIDRYPL